MDYNDISHNWLSLKIGVFMKHKIYLLVVAVFCIIYLQFGRDIEVCNSSIYTSKGYIEVKLNIVANKLYIGNEELPV